MELTVYLKRWVALSLLALSGACSFTITHPEQASEWPGATAPGQILFVSNQDGDREIYLAGPDGQAPEQLTNNERDDYEASWSPDGRHILFTSNRDGGNSEVYYMRADGSRQRNLSRWRGYDGQPSWSPDGQSIVFVSDRKGPLQLFSLAIDGTNPQQLTFDNEAGHDSPAWSPDGQLLAYRKLNIRAKGDLWLLDMRAMHHTQLTDNPKHEDGKPAWSPDSTSLLYHSRRQREYNIYRYDLVTGNERQLTDLPASDSNPVWSGDGSQISFLSTRGPYGRTQLFVMKEDGSDPRSITDGQSQVGDPVWLDDDGHMLLVQWQGNQSANVCSLDLATGELIPLAPAQGFQSEPKPAPFASRHTAQAMNSRFSTRYSGE
ncbi:hypothetical protein DWB85_17965 [Seongchinamella sediminis]|uniref:TolB protein n=1 Tax=Seongchinamella sediminis TaxID=2283635 RepID=A0A3L7DX55_9GAMM|nr:PD40 domain-containing protein [Seongchinamella sediminis]RLQ20382.1 hypothetical protein DWB85_17965 [Seongchinamella sediminis]